MKINAYQQSLGVSQNKLTDSGASIAVEGGNTSPLEKNNSDTVQISETARSKMLQELESGKFVDFTGENGMYKLGLMALGKSTIQDWSVKGLNLSDEAIVSAGKAFQDGFKQKLENSGSSLAGSGGLALNKYQIVINSQETPDWFTKEYENALSSMDNIEMKAAFEKGELFFSSKHFPSSVDALTSYTSINQL